VASAISVERARELVLATTPAPQLETVALARALDRVLGEDVRSAVDVPHFDSSAMDGFAVPLQATHAAGGADGGADEAVAGGDTELEIVDEARAGAPAGVAVASGTAVRISTGAAIPEGTGAVVPVERTSETGGGRVRVEAVVSGANVRPRGEVLRGGERVLRGGDVLGPAAVAVLATAGRAEVRCARQPRLAVVATGDELVEPGGALGPGEIWSSNPLALAGQATHAGAVVERIETVADDAGATRAAIGAAVGAADVVCVSGGVSVGPHDHVKPAFAALGVEQVFWGVALRPGRPTWFGVAADGHTLAFGLPGNPVSAMVCFHLFVAPALRALQGADPGATRGSAVLDAAIARQRSRDEAVRCRARQALDGPHVAPTGPQGSHVVTSMVAADCLALVPAGGGELAAGERVAVEWLPGRQ
jgi:molybdopterin molybdotransferase